MSIYTDLPNTGHSCCIADGACGFGAEQAAGVVALLVPGDSDKVLLSH